MQKSCTQCQDVFECGANSPAQQCWCMELPKIKPTDNGDCLCPKCLAARIKKLENINRADV